jgi:exodeoxyribonuclease-1
MSFIFYDTETTGRDDDRTGIINSKYGQITQFAAIFTDDSMNDLESDTINVHCRRQNFLMAEPGAYLITNMKPEEVDRRRISNYDMMRDVHFWFKKRTPAVVMGFNSMNFDEKFMRQGFYKTGFPVFTTNTNGNMRADLMRMVQAAFLHDPGKIKAVNPEGKQSFRLIDLCKANGVEMNEAKAHDALEDVRATVRLAKMLKQRCPKIWDQMMANADKQRVQFFVDSQDMFCLSEFYGGKSASYPVCQAVRHPTNDGHYALFDLRHEPEHYFAMSPLELAAVMGSRKKAGLRNLYCNQQPMIFNMRLAPKAEKALWPRQKDLRARAHAIRDNDGFQKKLGEAMEMTDSPRKAAAAFRRMLQTGDALPEFLPQMKKFATALAREDFEECKNQIDACVINRRDPEDVRGPQRKWKDMMRFLLDVSSRARNERELDFVEEKIFEKFARPSRQDQAQIDAFHRGLDWEERARVLPKIREKRWQNLLARVVYDNAPGALPDAMRREMDDWVTKRLRTDKPVPWVTYKEALRQLAEFQAKIDIAKDICKSRKKQTGDSEKAEAVLKELKKFGATRLPQLNALEKRVKWLYLYYQRTFGDDPIGPKPVPADQVAAFKPRSQKKIRAKAAQKGLDPSPLRLVTGTLEILPAAPIAPLAVEPAAKPPKP